MASTKEIQARLDAFRLDKEAAEEAVAAAKQALAAAEKQQRDVRDARQAAQREFETAATEEVANGQAWRCRCGAVCQTDGRACATCGCFELADGRVKRIPRSARADRAIEDAKSVPAPPAEGAQP